jgi:hypothetical protein
MCSQVKHRLRGLSLNSTTCFGLIRRPRIFPVCSAPQVSPTARLHRFDNVTIFLGTEWPLNEKTSARSTPAHLQPRVVYYWTSKHRMNLLPNFTIMQNPQIRLTCQNLGFRTPNEFSSQFHHHAISTDPSHLSKSGSNQDNKYTIILVHSDET